MNKQNQPKQNTQKGLINKVKIIPTKDLRTFDFHEFEGKPQTDEANKSIHNKIIYEPEESMTQGGESFEDAVNRAFGTLEDIMNEQGNKVIVTHNSMWGLMKLWEEEKRPQELSGEFRKKYTTQDTPEQNQKDTGEFFDIKNDKGINYVVRHGETEDNVKGVFRTAKAKLTEKGIEQAKKLGRMLKGKNIIKIYSSDLPRAIETSEIIKKEI